MFLGRLFPSYRFQNQWVKVTGLMDVRASIGALQLGVGMFVFKKKLGLSVVFLLIVAILAGCGGAEERKAKYLERGKAYFEEQNYEKAAVEFKNVLQIDPKTAAPYYYLGRIAEQDQDWRKAFGYYGKAVELDPELIDARVHLGRFYLLAGDMEKSSEQADEVLKREPANADAQVLRASLLMRQEKAG